MQWSGAQALLEAPDFSSMFANKPWTQQRKVLSLPLQRQLEETRDDRASASPATTATGPDLSSVTVDDVVVGDLIACSDCSAGDDVSDAVDRSHIRRGITRGVDVPFRRLHQHNAPAFEIVTVMRQFTGEKRMRGIYAATVIDSQDRFAEVVRSSGEDAKSINHRLLYDGMCHEETGCKTCPLAIPRSFARGSHRIRRENAGASSLDTCPSW